MVLVFSCYINRQGRLCLRYPGLRVEDGAARHFYIPRSDLHSWAIRFVVLESLHSLARIERAILGASDLARDLLQLLLTCIVAAKASIVARPAEIDRDYHGPPIESAGGQTDLHAPLN